MATGRKVLVVQNTPGGGPGRVGGWLREAGLGLDVVRAYAGEPLPVSLGSRALVVLGGGFLPDEDGRAPWLPAVRRLTGQALEGGNPVLGICLGGQLLAHVAGGRVRGRFGEPECGSTPVRLRAEARRDPLFGGLSAVVPAIERHVDAIAELPPGAVWLADSERCRYQGFRVGECAWGVQFHPEAVAADVRGWDRDWLRARGFDPDRLYDRAVADEPVSSAAWAAFTRRFAGIVARG
ncbi:type 1 glutamine amidotransferase [Streptomyces scopuliridis]|uniref:Type 1 glutamine amidotransferase n=1 Tax=Streptomyces scopuliridis TaxID=452529 RepID=A0ACD4ZW56_9ACTN|nr:type 1 glutamine amidotransferase [Streptomyces scopuliridis]WSB38257.1 type 1 glutamine amidotransferase [Streptomyces scopuliridis]WSC02690.1 type 1 glutamine amidotransferase [Streptomyces scopuliridis]WSC03778.1 type 1 glutamine amidotransferase [Streptomyces scopuliridis]